LTWVGRRTALALAGIVAAAAILLFVLAETGHDIRRDKASAPLLSLSGPLWDKEGEGPDIARGAYMLSVAAVDGDAGPESLEGVARITIGVDGAIVLDRRASCTTARCRVHVTWVFRVADYGPGEHAIRVSAKDRAGNVAVRDLDIGVAPRGRPSVRAPGCHLAATRPYRYVGQADNPYCRATLAGAIERGLSAKVSFGRGARVLLEPLRPGRHPLRDSFGQPFGFVEQVSLKRFRIYDERGRLFGTTTGSSVAEVQGRGCMVTDALAARHVIVVFYAPDGSTGTAAGGGERDVGARGLVPRDALPPGVFHRANPGDSPNNDLVIDRFDSGCGAPPSQPAAGLAGASMVKPSYSEVERYQGAKRHCASPTARTCGGHYSDYSRPHFSADAIALTSASTGVRNGGIVRAWARLSRPARLLDGIGYPDPNVPCGQSPAAQWFYVDANPGAGPGENHIYGWFPRRVTGLPIRRC
jgi:hypothetical protein